ncbi:MAG: glycosyltransferase family 2 protein [Chromatiales bacterium]|nr:glycosyltransferase family 2 protein [Chromatiales bacterium]
MLLKALAALHQACDPGHDEIFVVDNGSDDGSADEVARSWPDVQLIRNRCNNGFARANNQAIARAAGEFVVLLNNDAFLAPDTLARFEAVFQARPRCAVVAGQLLDADGGVQNSAKRIPTALDELGLGSLRRRPRIVHATTLTEVEAVVGACMAVRAEAIRDAGSLDNDFFFYFEETEWCHRFRRHGWQVLLEPQARITHLKGASTRGRRRGAQIEMLRSRLLYYRKTMPPATAIPLAAYRITRLLINAAVQAVAAVLTLGLVRPVRERLMVYGLQVVWLVAGCPDSWGLPDKCPREQAAQSATARA